MAIVPEAVGRKKNYTALLLLTSYFCFPGSLFLALCSLPSDAHCMKPLLLAALISFVALPLALSQTPSPTDNKTAEQEVRQMIEQYRTALTKKDTAALERIWADDYTFINASGAVVTKAERLANLKSGATSLDTIVTDSDMKIRIYGGDVAVAINRVTLKGQYSGKATSGQFQASIIWAKTPSGWQLVCNQITPVTSP
jgi:ketosteroid isomerase-like protein